MNRFIRKYVPKKKDIELFSEEFIASIVKKYDNTPREKLKWKTPNEVMKEKKLFRKRKNR